MDSIYFKELWKTFSKFFLGSGNISDTLSTRVSSVCKFYPGDLTSCQHFECNPLVPNKGRIALQDTILPTGGGVSGKSPIFIKKGTIYQTNSYVLHRDTGLWGLDAETFRPERWETHA